MARPGRKDGAGVSQVASIPTEETAVLKEGFACCRVIVGRMLLCFKIKIDKRIGDTAQSGKTKKG